MTYYKELSEYVKANDTANANRLVMIELGKSLVSDRDNFIAIFDNAGIEVDPKSSTPELIKKFVDNSDNRKLLLGASYLINHKYTSFDGEVNNSGIKATYKVMDDYFSEDVSGVVGPVVGAVAGAVGEGFKLGDTMAKNKAQKKFGSQMALDKSTAANQQLLQGALSQNRDSLSAKSADKKSKEKTLIILLSIGGVVLLGGIGLIWHLNSKK